MKKIIFAGLGITAVGIISVGIWVIVVLSDLPDVSVLKHYRPPAAAEILDRDGNVLTEYYDRKLRIWVPVSSLPDIVVQAVVTAEDDTFFEHKGVNYKAVWDALVLDVQKRRFARGGSTITQQMIKNVFLSRKKTISRKLREYVLARRAEDVLSKRQILDIYINEVEWGDNIYGIEAASRFYLDKHADELSVGEAALLAGMLPNPRYYNPFKRLDKARERQERVLANMLQAHLITPESYEAAVALPVNLRQEKSNRFDVDSRDTSAEKSCYLRLLEQILLRLFGEQTLYRSGWTIRTTLDKKMQENLVGRKSVAQEIDSAGPEPGGPVPMEGQITIVKQGDQVRAIICMPEEKSTAPAAAVLDGMPSDNYEESTVAIESITKDQIIQTVDKPRP
jgi:penicillin-binding protein 1A